LTENPDVRKPFSPNFEKKKERLPERETLFA